MAVDSQRKTFSEIINTFVLLCLVFAINFWFVKNEKCEEGNISIFSTSNLWVHQHSLEVPCTALSSKFLKWRSVSQ